MTFYGIGDTGSNFSGANAQAADAQRNANNAAQRAKQVENQVDRLTLICAAMWELIKERTNATEQDLVEKMAMLDAKDGVADGKISHRVHPCVKCGRPLGPRNQKCMYCGLQQPAASVFETL